MMVLSRHYIRHAYMLPLTQLAWRMKIHAEATPPHGGSAPPSWAEFKSIAEKNRGMLSWDRINGPTNSQANLRLFGKLKDEEAPETKVSVVLYRDKHAWCPYCQKVWLWLEEMQVPYRIEKVTMFCYGEKERWYKQKVPSGMLPAMQLDGRVVTESDVILESLEHKFGPLRFGMREPKVVACRKLERMLFRAWCMWLCSPSSVYAGVDKQARALFEEQLRAVEKKIAETNGPFLLEAFSTADVVLAPYIERMNASLFYYKGYRLRDPKRWPGIAGWFDAMEARETYRGTQSDFHTHVHDLPPQMGGCYSNGSQQAQENQRRIDSGPWEAKTGLDHFPDVGYPEPKSAKVEALHRVLKHKDSMLKANPMPKEVADPALRMALARMMRTSDTCTATTTSSTAGGGGERKAGDTNDDAPIPPKGSDKALRYMRDRVNVPRDMSPHAARQLRAALEATAALAGTGQGPSIPTQHRRDQDPTAFGR
mmetsp:Transcript_34519/g.67217  ORF Transcript_34519/g.67217 Transcript_34519/m.67217 type:complete len:481 (-) Transcript_34519:193-1635(-)